MPPTGILAGPLVGRPVDFEPFGEAKSLLEFYTVSRDWFGGERGIRRIEYVLRFEQDAEGATLVRLVTENLLSPTVAEPVEETLCRGIVGLDIAYSDGSEWLSHWDSTVREHRLPAAIKFDLTVLAAPSEVGEPPGLYRAERLFLLPAGTKQGLVQ